MIGKTENQRIFPVNLNLFSRIRFAHGTAAVTALALLYLATQTITKARTLKYVAAMMAAGILVDLFLSIQNKHRFLTFVVGLSMPFYMEVILIERDRARLCLTGTFLVISALALVSLSTGEWSRRPFNFVPLVSVPALIWAGAGFLSLINTTDQTATIISVVQGLEMLLVFLVLINSVADKDDLLLYLRGTFVAFTLECGIYYLQNILGYSFDIVGNVQVEGSTEIDEGRLGFMRGTFGTPHVAGTYFAAWTLLLIGFYLCSKRLKIYLNPVLGILMGGGCLILAAKRGPWLGFGIGLVFILAMLPRVDPRALKRFVGVGFALGIAMMVLLPVFLLRADANHEGALDERLNLNRVAWRMFHAHPILGVGLGTYNAVKRQYIPEDWIGWFYEVHNQYMMTLAETGIIGLVTSVTLYLMILFVAWRGVKTMQPDYRPLQLAVIAALIVVFWEMFWNMWYGRNCQYLIWFPAATAVILPKVLSSEKETTSSDNPLPV